MLKIIDEIENLRFFELMDVYEEGNRCNARVFYPHMDEHAGLINAEQDFYQYLCEVFFKSPGAFYAVWENSGRYVSAVRMEAYEDGLLVEGLETAPDKRGLGFASMLLGETIKTVSVPVYSHVAKGNILSLKTHQKCGFLYYMDIARCIDGKVDKDMVTLRWLPVNNRKNS